MGNKSSRVIWVLLTIFLVAALLVGCNRSATQPDEAEETTTEPGAQETPVQTMVTPTAQAGSGEPAATTEEPTEEAVPADQPTGDGVLAREGRIGGRGVSADHDSRRQYAVPGQRAAEAGEALAVGAVPGGLCR